MWRTSAENVLGSAGQRTEVGARAPRASPERIAHHVPASGAPTIDQDFLFERAQAVRERAYAPYSKYFVGAALLDETGTVHVGCNVENTAFPQGSCAEANAIGAMVTAGGRRIVAIAVVGGAGEIGACSPCGGCRQRIQEFSDKDTRVFVLDDRTNVVEHTLAELLPASTKPV